jgi:hypothetical protein
MGGKIPQGYYNQRKNDAAYGLLSPKRARWSQMLDIDPQSPGRLHECRGDRGRAGQLMLKGTSNHHISMPNF